MGTALGGASESPGGSPDDKTAQAATSTLPAGETSQEPQPGKSETVSRADYEKSVLAERNLRARLKVFEDEQAAKEAAALTDNQKLTKQLDKATQEAERFRQLYAETLVRFEAKELGYANADIGAALVLKELTFDDEGRPSNARDLLAARLKTDGYLASAPAEGGTQPPPTVANLGATNGGGKTAGQPTLADFRNGKLSMEDAARMWRDGTMKKLLDAERERTERR